MTIQVNQNVYNRSSYAQSSAAQISSSTQTLPESASSAKQTTPVSGVTVTLSNQVAEAQTRESLGLSPTGKIRLKDIEAAAMYQEISVESTLATYLDGLGIDSNQEMTLSLSADGNIKVSGSFPEKNALIKTLNSDDEFLESFSRMTANNELLSYSESIQSTNISLADFINGDTDYNDLMALSIRYEEIKSAPNQFETILNISRSENPYSYTYPPEAVKGS